MRGGLAEFGRERSTSARGRSHHETPTEADAAPAMGGLETSRSGRAIVRNRADVWRGLHDDRAALEDNVDGLRTENALGWSSPSSMRNVGGLVRRSEPPVSRRRLSSKIEYHRAFQRR